MGERRVKVRTVVDGISSQGLEVVEVGGRSGGDDLVSRKLGKLDGV